MLFLIHSHYHNCNWGQSFERPAGAETCMPCFNLDCVDKTYKLACI